MIFTNFTLLPKRPVGVWFIVSCASVNEFLSFMYGPTDIGVLKRFSFFFFQAEDGIRDRDVTGVQTCALPIWRGRVRPRGRRPRVLRLEDVLRVRAGQQPVLPGARGRRLRAGARADRRRARLDRKSVV